MKYKKLLTILLSAFLTVGLCLAGMACGCDDTFDPFTDETQQAISMVVSASADKLTVKLNSSEDKVGNKTAKVIGVKAYEYFKGDTLKGVSNNVVSSVEGGTAVGDYKLGTETTLEINRLTSDNYDLIYDKYYVILDDKILKGPVYATDIEAQVSANPTLNIKSKKGLLGENADYFEDLNCSYATLNFDIEKLVYPNEIIEDGEAIELAHPESDYLTFESNGKTYYFRKSVVDYFDTIVNNYYRQGAHVTAIIYSAKQTNEEIFPRSLTYYPYSTQGTVLMGLNTSNSYGFEYYVAIIEFLSNRYTSNNFANGYIGNFVVGNEVDYAKDYNRISEHQASLDVYMEEYSRLLRLTNLAAKKYHKGITVTIPFTQAWAKPGYELFPASQVQAYAPKDMIEWLNKKTKFEGDYDWGIAPHCYTYGLALSEVFLNDTVNGKKVGMTGDYNTSSKLTFSNLEILDQYLNQSELKYNNSARKVYLTESGVSSLDDAEKDKNVQAGAIASIWYKVSQLDSVVSWYYYRLYDHEAEVGAHLRPGLIDVNRETKPAYTVWKYIDTQYSSIVSKDYLKYLSYVDANKVTHSVANNNVTSYMDFLNVFGTSYNFDNFDWNKATPVTAETVYEYEDKIDLSSVKFESKLYIYDGTEKTIAATGMPSGVTVEYNVEPKLTEIGSKDVIATFKKNGEIVGRRKAKITVSKFATNKAVYNYGEKVFINISRENETLTKDAWVGIYRKGAVPGNVDSDEISYFYYYFNRFNDKLIRTVCLQETISNKAKELPVGDYVLYYFINNGYDYKYTINITVLPSGTDSGLVDLSDIEFKDNELVANGSAQSLTITGDLPSGVTVEYLNNTLTNAGTTQAVAIFKKDGLEIERRYAVLTVLPADFDRLTLNKTSYYEDESILVTAIAPSDSGENTWWVGLYLTSDTDFNTAKSIYWYYVIDANHTSGTAYNIKEQSFNAERINLKELPKGEYKMVLFNTSGYTVEKQIVFEILEAPISDDKGTVTSNKTQYDVGEDILITATRPANNFKSFWVGIYLLDDVIGTDQSIYYYYVVDDTHISGGTYNIKEQIAGNSRTEYLSLPAGKYKIVLFNTSGYTIEEQIQIQIGTDSDIPQAGTVSSNKTEYAVGEDILITAISNKPGAWVGIFVKGDVVGVHRNHAIYYYTVQDDNHTSGTAYNIKEQINDSNRNEFNNLPAGKYTIILFANAGYLIEEQFDIQIGTNDEQPAEVSLSTDKTEYAVGETIVVTTTCETSGAWVGIYNVTDNISTSDSLKYFYIENGSDKVYNFTEALQAGNYKLVLFRDGGYTAQAQCEITIA